MKHTLNAILLSAALVGSLASPASAVTQYVNGITASDGLSLTDLNADGWNTLVDVTYNNSVDNIGLQALAAATGSLYVFVGALDLQGNVILGATGLISEVLSQTFSPAVAASYSSSNLYWYNVDASSMGFTETQNIYLNAADVLGSGDYGGGADDGHNDLRLSWHDNEGGWRVGAITLLNDSSEYRKVVLVGGAATVPDATNSLLLTAMGLAAAVGVRRLHRA